MATRRKAKAAESAWPADKVERRAPTQINDGGMSDIYRAGGTYVKSFYTVMYAPSCVVVQDMSAGFHRLHHKVNWNRTAPKIIREEYRKAAA